MTADRDASGRFLPGNPGGPGNPNVRRIGELQAAVRDAVTPDDLRAVLRRLHELALAGDVAAARVLLDRVCGRPQATIDVQAAVAHVVAEGPPVPPMQDYQDPATGKWRMGLVTSARKLADLLAEYGDGEAAAQIGDDREAE